MCTCVSWVFRSCGSGTWYWTYTLLCAGHLLGMKHVCFCFSMQTVDKLVWREARENILAQHNLFSTFCSVLRTENRLDNWNFARGLMVTQSEILPGISIWPCSLLSLVISMCQLLLASDVAVTFFTSPSCASFSIWSAFQLSHDSYLQTNVAVYKLTVVCVW